MAGNIPPKIKPLADALVDVFEPVSGAPLGRYTAPIIVPLHVANGKVYAASALLDSSGVVVGSLSINGISVAEWPVARRQMGRPKGDEKHMAVFLSWCLALARNGMKRGSADESVKALFRYATTRGKGGVSDIRARVASAIGIDLDKDLLIVKDCSGKGHLEYAVCLKNTTVYHDPGCITVLGTGWSWFHAFATDPDRRSRVISGAHKIEILTTGVSRGDLDEIETILSGIGGKVITSISTGVK